MGIQKKKLGTGAVVPFMPVFARQLGFSPFVVGIIYSILPILGLISKPLFGAIADRYVHISRANNKSDERNRMKMIIAKFNWISRYQRHKLMFVIFIFLTIGAFTSIKFIEPISKSTRIDYHCNGLADLKYCPNALDHCAADLFLSNENKTTVKEYTFDVRIYCLFRHLILIEIRTATKISRQNQLLICKCCNYSSYAAK